MKTIKLAMLGYGNAGQAFVRMLNRKRDYFKDTFDTKVLITAICTGTKGNVINKDGIDIEKINADLDLYGRFSDTVDLSTMQIIDEADYDVLLELTPINIKSGQPAIDHIKHAFKRGMHAITANKGPIAWAFDELNELAKQSNSLFFYETTVMDGVPVYNLVQETLKGCEIIEIQGILNSTTNYVIKEISKGITYDDAVKEGQRRGFVEADPSMDLDGWDATAKLTALMNVFMHAGINPNDIDRQGITPDVKTLIDEADKKGKLVKLLCHGKIVDGKAVGTVKPTEIDKDNMLSTVSGTGAAVTFTTDLIGGVSIVQHEFEPEIDQTAYGILSDLIRVITVLNEV